MSTRLINTCTRPVELHLSGGVVVLPAMSAVDCAAEDLALGQVRALCGRGVLVAHPEATESQDAGSEAVGSDDPPPARRSSSTRRRKS